MSENRLITRAIYPRNESKWNMNRRTIYRKLVLLACFATLASRLFGETVAPLTSELEHVLAEISIVPPPLDAPNEMRIWERRMRALAKGSHMATNLWPALPALVTLAGHTNLQVSISAAVLIANAKPDQHPQWNQVQAQLRSTTNAYRGFECLLPGPDQYTRFYNPPNRRFAIAVLGIIGPPAKSVAPSLVRLLKSDAEIDVPLWCHAAGSLHGMGIDGDVYLPILRKRFADSAEDLVVRSVVAHALACAKASDAETIALLRGGLNDFVCTGPAWSCPSVYFSSASRLLKCSPR